MPAAFCRFLFKIWGWKVESPYPYQEKKVVLIVIPHTSNWDFPLGLITRCALEINCKFVAKDSLFRWPYGFLFRWMGGIPVDRSRSNNFVENVAAQIKESNDWSIVMSPEGTRKKVDKLKSGFYFIALQAGVPIVMCKFDWSKKMIGFSEPFHPTGDFEKDLKKILEFFKDAKGYRPELGYLS